MIRLSVLGGWIWPDWRAWVLDPAKSGGHELHNGVHLLDLVTWWMGDRPTRVFARGRKQTAAELEIHDYLELVVEFEGGGVAVCEMSRGHRPATLGYRDVLAVGDGGSLAVPWDAAASVLFGESGTALLPVAESDGFATQLDAWLTAVRGGPDPMPAAEAALAVTLAVAARRSIADGVPVEVAA
nr:Gfo/Idh/MocA family oxidoreductase [Jiangella mangrovi]